MTIEQPISPDTPISVTLQAQEWNTVVAILQDAPYKIVAGVINKTVQQMQAGALAAQASLPKPPNGADTITP